ncbi:hypothetical protein [Pararcticibacter amylolyticus]|uniref:hypothetical protein n=1 Tax=Pararcticibacter amylolyticus TaxID=2173175 RepID=UPI00192E6213|nr:hypothetical protein [Pararcticibacter amylolyticus]
MWYRLVAILLLITVISSNFSRFYVYAGFELNKAYIAKELCENRSRPAMHCNGKCYLMKKLRAAEEKEKEQESKGNSNRLEISFFQEPFNLSFNQPAIAGGNSSHVPFYSYLYTSQHIDSVFRPPKQTA